MDSGFRRSDGRGAYAAIALGQLFRIQEVVIARRLRRGNLDGAAATPVSKGSFAPTGLPRCARNDIFPASLNSYALGKGLTSATNIYMLRFILLDIIVPAII